MSNALTIDELKSLEVGDWVFIVNKNLDWLEEGYGKIQSQVSKYVKNPRDLYVVMGNSFCPLPYSNYGAMWLAYKNKEQAEAKGEIVELPCKPGSTVYAIIDKLIVTYIARKISTDDYNFFYTRPRGAGRELQFGHNVFVTREEAERRLDELKGELK